jgi:hypothetical protein
MIILSPLVLSSCGSKGERSFEGKRLGRQEIVGMSCWRSKHVKGTSNGTGLKMEVSIEHDTIRFNYANISDTSICLWTKTEGYGLTWNKVVLTNHYGKKVKIAFDPGFRAHPGHAVLKCLSPGGSCSEKEDLAALIKFRMEEKVLPLIPKGSYRLDAFYLVRKPMELEVFPEDQGHPYWQEELAVHDLYFVME